MTIMVIALKINTDVLFLMKDCFFLFGFVLVFCFLNPIICIFPEFSFNAVEFHFVLLHHPPCLQRALSSTLTAKRVLYKNILNK